MCSLFAGALYNNVDIYLEESGDLGFTFPGSSHHLVVAAMATNDSKDLSRIPKKARKKLHIIGMDKELKISNSGEGIRNYFLNEINKVDCLVVWGAINKHNVSNHLREDSTYLYNYLCGLVLCDIFTRVHSKKINLIFDRRAVKKVHRERLDDHIGEKIISNHSGNFVPELKISHYDSLNCHAFKRTISLSAPYFTER